MPRRPNATIGMVRCTFPTCGKLGAVRREKSSGRLYYVCECGGPYYASAYVEAHATLWNDAPAPDDAPEWIRRGLTFKPGTREGGDRPRAPTPAPAPAPEPAPPATSSDPEPDPRWRGGLFV
jgi:hypothetical protein